MEIPRHLLPEKLQREVTAFQRWALVAKIGTTKEMVLDPDYWVDHARTIKPYDHINVRAEDGSFNLDLLVDGVDPRGYWLKVKVLRELVGTKVRSAPAFPTLEPDEDGYTISWGSKHQQWRIIDRYNNILEKDIASKEEAIERLAHIKAEKVAA